MRLKFENLEACFLWINKFDKNSVGLYRDDGLALFKNINGHRVDKTRKELHQLFKENGLSLEIDCSLKTVNYLDITVDLNTGTYKLYRKPNDEILISTLIPIILHTFWNNYLYQSKLDYLTFPAILEFFLKHLNNIKISSINLGMTTNYNKNHQTLNM